MTFSEIQKYAKKYKENDERNAEWMACISYALGKKVKATALKLEAMYFAGYLYPSKTGNIRNFKKMENELIAQYIINVDTVEAQLVNAACNYVNLRKKKDHDTVLKALKKDLIPKNFNILKSVLVDENLTEPIEVIKA